MAATEKTIEMESTSQRVIAVDDSILESHTEQFVPQLTNFVGENWGTEFKNPFEKFPPNVLRHCSEGSRPKPDERNHIIRILAYEISKISKKPVKKNLEIIVAKFIKQYPKSFQDMIANKPFGNGYASFLHSLILRFDNMNRSKRNSLIAKLPENEKKAKKRCNFQPGNLPSEETEDSQIEKKKWLQNHFLRKEQDEEEINKAMAITFVSQRRTINTAKLVEEIIKEWPYLATSQYLLEHFNVAMQPYRPDWECIFNKKIPELLSYLKGKVAADASECSPIAILQLLCIHFKEVNTVVQIYKVIFYAMIFILSILHLNYIFE